MIILLRNAAGVQEHGIEVKLPFPPVAITTLASASYSTVGLPPVILCSALSCTRIVQPSWSVRWLHVGTRGTGGTCTLWACCSRSAKAEFGLNRRSMPSWGLCKKIFPWVSPTALSSELPSKPCVSRIEAFVCVHVRLRGRGLMLLCNECERGVRVHQFVQLNLFVCIEWHVQSQKVSAQRWRFPIYWLKLHSRLLIVLHSRLSRYTLEVNDLQYESWETSEAARVRIYVTACVPIWHCLIITFFWISLANCFQGSVPAQGAICAFVVFI